ncbi:hypothetical protein GGR57DRAFT_115369 [Xylariaceae sp. FL1272]|nr:hypothetical protein GGR57DRAFT_115369 [Xylariaceae sp. FL1272]
MAPSPVDAGSAGSSTASEDPSFASPPHPTYGEAAQLALAITDQQAAVVDPSPAPVLTPEAHDTGAVLTASTGVNGNSAVTHPKMLFSEFYKSTRLPLSRLRQPQQQPHSPSVSDTREYDPDLVSKDRNKQKEAVKRFLASNIRSDWVFKWPLTPETNGRGNTAPEQNSDAPDETSPSNEPSPEAINTKIDPSEKHNAQNEETCGEDDDASTYSTVSEDQDHFAPRLEWLSDWSDDDDELDEPVSPSAYRFESPDAIGSTVKASQLARSAKHRRAVRAEMEWNTGLACFNARRDAWTGARTARIRPKPTTSTVSSPTTGRRVSFWRLSTSATPSSPTDPAHNPTPLSPTATRTSGDTTAISSSDNDSKDSRSKEDSSKYPVQTMLPIPPPLLPPTNPMRASITAATYAAIYDKIVLEALMPACPVNLRDVLCSCVVGWKRDGEWPPKAVEINPVVAVRSKKKKKDTNITSSRRLSFNFLGRRLSAGGDVSSASKQPHSPKDDDANATNGVKRSLSKVLRLGHDKPSTSGVAT